MVNFKSWDVVTEEEESLNGLTRADTDRNIIKYFGTMDDFLITSMSSQLGALSFINEGSTKRKEILAKFLDLEIFDKKYKTAKDDAADLKSEIKILDATDYDTELKKVRSELVNNGIITGEKKISCGKCKEVIEAVTIEKKELQDKLDSAPTELIDIVNIRKEIKVNEKKLLSYEKDLASKKDDNEKNKNKIQRAEDFIRAFDMDSLSAKKDRHTTKLQQLDALVLELEQNSATMNQAEKQVELLKEVPCGSEFSHCKFICGAYEAKKEIPLIQLSLNSSKTQMEAIENEIEQIGIREVEKELQKFDELVELTKELENKIPTEELLIENLVSRISIIEHELKDSYEKKKLYEDNKEVIENSMSIVDEIRIKDQELQKHIVELEKCEEDLLELYKMDGYYEQKIENLEKEKAKCEKIKNDYEAYDLYMKCMHPNGIAYNIIKESLPTINNEISKILANIVDFQVNFETDDKRLDIYIQHPDQDPSPLEMASGAEKTVAAMAIRLAFTNISSLPKSQLFILDEPGTALDADRMEGFVRILDITSSIFKTVILISHLDSLKDAADSIITIEKKDGYANVTA